MSHPGTPHIFSQVRWALPSTQEQTTHQRTSSVDQQCIGSRIKQNGNTMEGEEEDIERKRRSKRVLLLAYYHYNFQRTKAYFRQSLDLEGRRRRGRGLNRSALVDSESIQYAHHSSPLSHFPWDGYVT